MGKARWCVLTTLSLLACKREVAPAPAAAPPALAAQDAAAHPGAASADPTWYRAVVRASDGVEAIFLLGVPPAHAPGQAVFKVGGHEIRGAAAFDGKTLRVPFAVHQTAVEATVEPDGTLRGSFTASWRALGASSLPLTATPVAAPETRALATIPSSAAPLDLGQQRSVWRVAFHDSGPARLVIDQAAPGDLAARLMLDTGNIIYLAGNGRGDAMVLCGFDGTSAYRLELTLGTDLARGRLLAGPHFDWRETLTATRGPDFTLAVKPRAARPGIKIGLPDHPALAALEPGPLVVELGASWCSSCRNAAPFFVELQREYQQRGLRMLTLLYELSDDRALDASQAETFKTTYGAAWPVVAISGGLDDLPDTLPTGLSDVNPAGFPITLFLAADRSLVALHAGFPAADAPDEFARVAAEFRANIETLLAGRGASRRR
jgi:thiol-disulfide isomerase/thioredoxin